MTEENGGRDAEALLRQMNYAVASCLSLPQTRTNGSVVTGHASAKILFLMQKMLDEERGGTSELSRSVSCSLRDSLTALGFPFKVKYTGLLDMKSTLVDLARRSFVQYLQRMQAIRGVVAEVGLKTPATVLHMVFPQRLLSPAELRTEMRARGVTNAYVILPVLSNDGGYSKVFASNYRKYQGRYNFSSPTTPLVYPSAAYTGYLSDDDVFTDNALYHTRVAHIDKEWFMTVVCDVTPDCHPMTGLAEVHRAAFETTKTRVVVPYEIAIPKMNGVCDVRYAATACAGCYAEAKVVVIAGIPPEPPYPFAEVAYEAVPRFQGGDLKVFLRSAVIGHRARVSVKNAPDGLCYLRLLKPSVLAKLDRKKLTPMLTAGVCHYISANCKREDFVAHARLEGEKGKLHVALGDGPGLKASGYDIFSMVASCMLVSTEKIVGSSSVGYCWVRFVPYSLWSVWLAAFPSFMSLSDFFVTLWHFGVGGHGRFFDTDKGFHVELERKVFPLSVKDIEVDSSDLGEKNLCFEDDCEDLCFESIIHVGFDMKHIVSSLFSNITVVGLLFHGFSPHGVSIFYFRFSLYVCCLYAVVIHLSGR